MVVAVTRDGSSPTVTVNPEFGRRPIVARVTAPARAPTSTDYSSIKPDRVVLAVENMNCGSCIRRIEQALGAIPGVEAARCNLSAKRVTVNVTAAGPDREALIAVLSDSGYRASELIDTTTEESRRRDRDLLKRLGVAGFAAANVMLMSVSVWAGLASDMDADLRDLFHWLSLLIAVPAIAYAGLPFFRSAATALDAWRLNMDVPISLALILVTSMSVVQTVRGSEHVFFDAAISLTFFLLIGRYLDQSMRTRAAGAAQNLLGFKAAWATLIRADGTSRRCPARELIPGDRVLVAAGERIPVDGRVVAGASDIDESLMTGETLPRCVAVGGDVHAGTIALTAPLAVETTASDDDTLLAEVARLMEAGEQNRGRYVRLADRAAAFYAPTVHILGLATLIGWLAFGAGWEAAALSAIAVLIITCPCALALAVPAVQVAATSRLFQGGVIITAGDGLERIAETDTVVFDKTGTLTGGKPTLANANAIADTDLLAAASLAATSHHPYAMAVVREAVTRGLEVSPLADVFETPGAGLCVAAGREGRRMRLGSADWCSVQPGEDTAGTQLWFRAAADCAAIGFIFEDVAKPDAKEAVAALKRAGVDVIILSGDRPDVVRTVAQQLDISDWFAAQRPPDKIAHLERLKAEGRRVLMIGDGLNDAPALAAAHASLSPASAVDISQVASDGIIQGERLMPVIETLATARRARRMAFENFAIAAAYNAICIPLAMAGLVTPLIAAIAMSASSIVVTANALRLRTVRLRLRS